MYRNASIGIVIPAYNEEQHIGTVIETLPEYIDRAYVIDDGSTDDTWEIIQDRARARNAQTPDDASQTDGGQARVMSGEVVQPIRHEVNRGVGGAIKTGYQWALKEEVDITVVVGGDGQMRPEQILRLVEPIIDGRADYAKGNRLLGRKSHRGMPGFRYVGNTILSVLTKISSGYWKTMDPQNGFTAISREALEAIDIERLYEDYGYCNEMLVRLNVARLRVADVVIPAVYADEKSHIKYSKYIPRVSMLLLKNFHWRMRATFLTRDFNPLVFLYGFGLLLTFSGVLAAVVAVGRSLSVGGTLLEPLLASGLVWSLGIIVLILAMIFDMQANQGRELQINAE